MIDTIIVGAGLAGLAAGQFLTENGQLNFVILECANEIGGRIRTVEFQGKQFAIGPGWVHGQKGNPMFDIINDIGIQLVKCDCDEDNFFVWNVKEERDITKEFEDKTCAFDELFLDIVDKVKDKQLSPELSVADVILEYDSTFHNKSDVDRTVVYITKEIYMGAPMDQVSGKIDLQLDQIYNLDDNEVNFEIVDPMGMLKFANYLSKDFTEKIKLNCKVDTIKWDEISHVATVVTKDGKQFNCKNVILTLQCDLLLNNSIKFVPELPIIKTTAWQRVHSVNYCRLFAKFPRKFWPNKKWLISVISDVDPFNELILWQNGCKQNVCSDNDTILICHFTSGYSKGRSRFDVDKMALIDIVSQSMKNMFPSTYCAPDDVLFVSHWDQDRFAGSFSIIAPGFSDAMIESLDKSIGPLHFAGESVSVHLTGTMQAAYVTGRKAAKRTLN